MKLQFLTIPFLSFILIGLSSCEITEERRFDNHIEDIEAFLEENNLVAETTDSDLYYIIHEAGNDILRPNEFNVVEIDYEAFSLDGEKYKSTFDEGIPRIDTLGRLPEGLKEGIPFLGVGGRATFLMPGELAIDTILEDQPKNEAVRIELRLLNF